MKVVVVGCTHAGIAAVTQIFKAHPDTEVTIYERNDNVSFLSCGISLYLNGDVKRLEDMFYASPEDLEKQGATVRTQHDVLSVDTKAHQLTAQNMVTKEVFTDTYDKLIMTTGSYVVVPPLMGIDDSRVLLCKSYEQAKQLYKAAKVHKHIAIVGGGYVGVELAEAYADTKHEVTLMQSHDQVLNNYVGPLISGKITELLKTHGVHVLLNEKVQAFHGNDQTDNILIETSKGEHKADLAIVSTGFMANTGLLQGQVDMDRHGAILVNEYEQTSNADVYAAGDACISHFNPAGNDAYIPLATNAVRQGALAGMNIFGEVQKDMGTQATSAMELFGYTLATSGLTLNAAKKEGLDATSVIYEGNYRPSYMPTTDLLTIELVYNRKNRQVLGAQLFSKHEVSQSANAISICIQNKNTIDDLAFVDMLFQPHYDEPFNYLNLVAQLAIEQERQTNQVK
ncbi:FAD-dependent oxidoreductase [Pediococcus damnosus]|uniref:FAD-dependent oxidoreductase n=1 Tax=Pediococcus damnosus TaxID=51663 RepID=UPI00078D5866|nr:FAD-dependent oxidoreductase [Pediococcus damnosus]AMV60503.1 NADH oxidase [Pediococcus damnosus]AMV64818.1 NADH oxidase [Pediococcus damnosus]PIO81142.1 NADH oxidase [Pediococcus damnosus]PIO85367.1 NADH oxidase [Pediococcus damnosus]GEA92967.1 NADH oxidase [Pediococcus damnosus]